MSSIKEKVEAYIDSKRDDILRDWENLVNIEGKCTELENMKTVVEHLYQLFTDAGVKCQIIPTREDTPSVLTGIWGEEFPGKPIIFGGHYDTVFVKGQFGEKPFRIEDGKAYGPGCLDMKGGIIITLYIIKALKEAGYNERPIKIVFCGDEEAGANHLDVVAPVITKVCEGCLCGFNMETGPINNDLCVGRKGAMGGKFTVHGVSAHSGNNFEVGRNALIEAAHKMIAIDALTDMELGTHINVGIVHGGTMANIIPDRCDVVWSARFAVAADMDRVAHAVEELFKTVTVEGTSAEHTFTVRLDVFEETEANKKLWKFVSQVSERNGFGKMGHVFLGGGSDAIWMSKAGMPVLCSCGVRGEWNHTEREYAVVESMFERAKLFANVVLESGELA